MGVPRPLVRTLGATSVAGGSPTESGRASHVVTRLPTPVRHVADQAGLLLGNLATRADAPAPEIQSMDVAHEGKRATDVCSKTKPNEPL